MEVTAEINAEGENYGKMEGGNKEGKLLESNPDKGEIKEKTDISISKNKFKITDAIGDKSAQAGNDNGLDMGELVVVDPKRRRVGQEQENVKKDHEEDTNMLIQEDIIHNQKNGLRAGAAMQALLSS